MIPLIADPYTILPVNEKYFAELPNVYRGDILPSVNDSGEEFPSVLLPYQQKWLADRSQVKLWEKSRRIGASWTQALDSVLTAVAEDGEDSWYVGYNRDMAKQFIEDAAYWAKALSLSVGTIEEFIYLDESAFDDEDKNILAFRIDFASGYSISALSSKPNNLRGKKGTVILDEFAFHQNPDQLIKSAVALQIWGGRLIILSTHNGIASEFNNLITAIKQCERDISHHYTNFRMAINDGLYKRICESSGKEWTLEGEFVWVADIYRQYGIYAAEELDCVPSKDNDALFKIEDLDSAFIGQWQDPIAGHHYVASIDPSFGGADGFSMGIFDISKLPHRLVAEYCQSNQSSPENQKQVVSLIQKYKVFFLGIERNSGGIVIAENLQLAMPKLNIQLFNTTQSSKIIATDSLAVTIEDCDLIFPEDWKRGYSEFSSFSKKLRKALVGHDDRVMMCAIFRHFLADAIALIPKASKAIAAPGTYKKLKVD